MAARPGERATALGQASESALARAEETNREDVLDILKKHLELFRSGSTITEPSTGGYARQAVNFAAASGGSAAMSDAQLEWTNGAATVWNVVGVAICDALTVGNMLAFDNDVADASVAENDTVRLTDLTVALT